ncbi:MAG: S8 family serine peptidase [Gammaproteobacteria bacterium]|nr:S8 family serine peptidase [Gammaproteobacteria bacterium]
MVLSTIAQADGMLERVIVKYKDGQRLSVQAVAVNVGGEVKVELDWLNAFAVEIPSTALDALRNNPQVEYIEPDFKRYQQSTDLNTTEVKPYGLAKVQADLVSDAQAANRKICIIDSGYDISHSDLSSNIVSGAGEWAKPGSSHGTHVAGTIAAITNDIGVKGVMPSGNIGIHIIKVFGDNNKWVYTSNLLSAVNQCAGEGANVINMSLGGNDPSSFEQDGFKIIANNNVLILASAGNDGNTKLNYPASYDSIMSVGAVDSNNQHAYFSQFNKAVEIAAPGMSILSTVVRGNGTLAQLDVGGTDYFADGVVPHDYFIINQAGDEYIIVPGANRGEVSGLLGKCTTSGASYSCPDMYNKVCLVERGENEANGNLPEYKAAEACINAGAAGVIVYSDKTQPGLQKYRMIDPNKTIKGTPTASVDRATGMALVAQVGKLVHFSVQGNQDWKYENGTSMAAPHASAVAALVWSHHAGCSAANVRNALTSTALDIDRHGRDDKTGHGLVQARAAVDYLSANCGNFPPAPAPSLNTTGQTGSVLRVVGSDGSDDLYIRVQRNNSMLNDVMLSGVPGVIDGTTFIGVDQIDINTLSNADSVELDIESETIQVNVNDNANYSDVVAIVNLQTPQNINSVFAGFNFKAKKVEMEMLNYSNLLDVELGFDLAGHDGVIKVAAENINSGTTSMAYLGDGGNGKDTVELEGLGQGRFEQSGSIIADQVKIGIEGDLFLEAGSTALVDALECDYAIKGSLGFINATTPRLTCDKATVLVEGSVSVSNTVVIEAVDCNVNNNSLVCRQ